MHYLKPKKRQEGVINRLRHAKSFKHCAAETKNFKNALVPYYVNNHK